MGACVFAVALMLLQLIQKTNPLFALGSFFFIMVSVATFNLAGGFSKPSGAYVFFYATLAVIVGLCTKAALWQPADSYLETPKLLIAIYLVSICGMYGAVFVARKLSLKKGLLQDIIPDRAMLDSAVGCMVSGLAIDIAVAVMPRSEGSILSALNQVNKFLPMSIILATIYQIRKTGGKSSINLVVLIAGGINTLLGLLIFSKEGIFTGVICWLMAASSQRYKLSRVQVVGLVLGGLLMSQYLVPYSQFGRSYNEDPSSSTTQNAIYLLMHLDMVRETYKANQSEALNDMPSYFGQDIGFLDRLQMLGPDDSLITVTEERGPFGMLPIYGAFANLVPHFIWPDKPLVYFGNIYAHEVGNIIAEDDVSTGISFSPSGEGFHVARWYGVALLAPALWIMLFVVFDSLCGSTLIAPWGLLAMVIFAHQAPEGMLSGVIYCTGYVAFSILVAAFSSAYLMPILGGLLKGADRGAPLQPLEMRVVPSGVLRADSRQ